MRDNSCQHRTGSAALIFSASLAPGDASRLQLSGRQARHHVTLTWEVGTGWWALWGTARTRFQKLKLKWAVMSRLTKKQRDNLRGRGTPSTPPLQFGEIWFGCLSPMQCNGPCTKRRIKTISFISLLLAIWPSQIKVQFAKYVPSNCRTYFQQLD